MERDRCAVVGLFQAGYKPKRKFPKCSKCQGEEECMLLGPLRDIWRLEMLRIGPGVDVRVLL